MMSDDDDLPHAPHINRAAFSYYERLGRVQQYVEANLANGVTLDRAAVVACLSRSHFCGLFHNAVGVTFMDWLHYKQVREAARVLRAHDHPIAQLADEAGFRSVRTFERCFRRWVGATPNEYRIAHRPGGKREVAPIRR